MPRHINTSTLRILYARSGNCCAFNGCSCPIFEDNNILTGECCHIAAASSQGPRYNKEQSEVERNGYDNLVLLCSRHHKIIDSDPNEYSIEKLIEMKKNHEIRFSAQYLSLNNQMLNQLQIESERYWHSISEADYKDTTGFKMKLDESSPIVLMQQIEEDYRMLQEMIDSICCSSDSLQSDLEKECLKCGIDFDLFKKIPYFENSLVNRDWLLTHIGFPNVMNKLKLKYLLLRATFSIYL